AGFDRFFKKLFGGGRADLVWCEPENVLDSGLEIVARPPGKRAQSLAALSGGERALATIALLFAIMNVRPSPFYVLDEIDAALDERNVERFAALLREYSENRQIVMITHRQATME